MNTRIPGVLAATALITLAILAPLSRGLHAQEATPAKVDPRIELAKRIPGAHPDDFKPSPVAGIYELTRGTDISYVTVDAKYVFSGDLYRIDAKGEFPNLSDERRRSIRQHLMASADESQMLVFSPKAPKYTVTVFTDVDCTWCRKLHSQIAEYNRLGVKVRYMFYPRSGPNTESWTKAEEVWCSPNRNQALTLAKLDQLPKVKACGATPVRQEYELGKDLGVTATPAIMLDDGELLMGYVEPANLVKRLQVAAR
jgi:thiol:disulfide interchange protein DsbC